MDPIRQGRVGRGRWLTTSAGLFVALATFGCASGPEDLCHVARVEDEAGYRRQIEEQRQQKESQFRLAAQSPVPDSLRTRWEGLEFFPVDTRYRLAGPLIRRTNGRSFQMATTTGELRPCHEVGYFLVDLGAGPEELPVYAFDGEEGEDLFLPFTDATTEADETYPAGRYLDVVLLDRGRYLLDFNRAYNPYCAYGGAWNCPIAPKENRLQAAVRAGERGWHGEELSSSEDER